MYSEAPAEHGGPAIGARLKLDSKDGFTKDEQLAEGSIPASSTKQSPKPCNACNALSP